MPQGGMPMGGMPAGGAAPMGMAGMGGRPGMGGQPMGMAGGADDTPPDMECTSGSQAAAWQSVKNRFRNIFTGPGGGFVLTPREQLVATLHGAMEDLMATKALTGESGDCGLGRLCLQILSVLTVEDPAALVSLLQQTEQLAS